MILRPSSKPYKRPCIELFCTVVCIVWRVKFEIESGIGSRLGSILKIV